MRVWLLGGVAIPAGGGLSLRTHGFAHESKYHTETVEMGRVTAHGGPRLLSSDVGYYRTAQTVYLLMVLFVCLYV